MIKQALFFFFVTLLIAACTIPETDPYSNMMMIFIKPPNSVWSITIESNGMVCADFSATPGDEVCLPQGSVDFADLKIKLKPLLVDHKVEGGTQVGFYTGQTSVVSSYISDDQLLRDLFPKDPEAWKIILPEAEVTTTGEIEIVGYDMRPLSDELRIMFLEHPIYSIENKKRQSSNQPSEVVRQR